MATPCASTIALMAAFRSFTSRCAHRSRTRVRPVRGTESCCAVALIVAGCSPRLNRRTRNGAVCKRLGPHFAGAILHDAVSLHAERVLVDRDHVAVEKDRARRSRPCARCRCRRSAARPSSPTARNASDTRLASCRHCRPRACRGRSSGPGPAIRPERLVQIDDVGAPVRPVVRLVPGREAVPDVAGGAPQIADVLRPQPRLGRAPLAHREDDRPAALRGAHRPSPHRLPWHCGRRCCTSRISDNRRPSGHRSARPDIHGPGCRAGRRRSAARRRNRCRT